MARLRYNGLAATLGGAGLAPADTTVTFSAALTHSGGTAVPTITGSDYIPLVVLDANAVPAEIVNLTAYTSGATTGTITRAQEATPAGTHPAGRAIHNGLTVADVNTFTSGGSGARVLLKETVLSSAAATVTFSASDIPTSGYRDLILRVLARSAAAASDDAVLISYNGDTTAGNYTSQMQYTINTTNYGDASLPRAIGYVDGGAIGTELASDGGVIDARIHGFLDTNWRKVAMSMFYVPNDPMSGRLGSRWKNTAAITSLSLTLNSAGNFMAGSRFALYAEV